MTDSSDGTSSNSSGAESHPEFGSTHDYDATASASLSEQPIAPEPGAIGAPGTGPGWNTYSGVGNGPGWSDQPTYPPTESEQAQFDTGQQAYGGHNYVGQNYSGHEYATPGQPTYGQAQPTYGNYQAYGPFDPAAPYGRDPLNGEALSEKSRLAAGLLQILLGFVGICGIGRLYIGSTGVGLAQLVLVLIGYATMFILIGFVIVPIVWLWAFIDGILMLTGTVRDAQGRKLRN